MQFSLIFVFASAKAEWDYGGAELRCVPGWLFFVPQADPHGVF